MASRITSAFRPPGRAQSKEVVMLVQMSAGHDHLTDEDMAVIRKDLDKLERRLHEHQDIKAELRIAGQGGSPDHRVTVELHYGHNHLVAKVSDYDTRVAVNKATAELMRQINDRARGGHNSFVNATKHR